MNKYKVTYYLKNGTTITVDLLTKASLEKIEKQYDLAINSYKTIIEQIKDQKTTIIKIDEIACVEINKIDKMKEGKK